MYMHDSINLINFLLMFRSLKNLDSATWCNKRVKFVSIAIQTIITIYRP